MALEVVEEGGPVGLEAMRLEIAQRKREAVVDANQGRHLLSQSLRQPFGDPPSGQYLRGDGGGGTSTGDNSSVAR
jgi:hypothetical protein